VIRACVGSVVVAPHSIQDQLSFLASLDLFLSVIRSVPLFFSV
jgi:hypothetical protein